MSTRPPDLQRILGRLSARFGLTLQGQVRKGPAGTLLDVRVADLHPNEGFLIRTTIGWRSIRAEFLLGEWAAALIEEMGRAPREKQDSFATLANAVQANGGNVSLLINGVQRDPLQTQSWPPTWASVSFSVDSGLVDPDISSTERLELAVSYWAGAALGMIVCLLPFEDELFKEPEVVGLPEGAKSVVEVNRYERNPTNRALCIAARGLLCTVCKFDFGAFYGPIGEDFVEVHHLVPVSKLGPGYVVNPTIDLVPVCSNCHSMIHRRDPPFSVEELRKQMDDRKSL